MSAGTHHRAPDIPALTPEMTALRCTLLIAGHHGITLVPDQLPPLVRDRIGADRSTQLGKLVRAMIHATAETGRIGMTNYYAEALAEFRRFNYEEVYLRPASNAQAEAVIAMLRALVEHYAAKPFLVPDGDQLPAGSAEALRTAVAYVGGMTDRFACRQAMALLDWERDRLPVGIDV